LIGVNTRSPHRRHLAPMAVHNADIARCFEELADLLELRDENPFRVRAYRNAARVVGELRLDIAPPGPASCWSSSGAGSRPASPSC
jgi:hypothetical protein